MGEFLAVLGIVFLLQSILVVGLTAILIRRGYLPKIFDNEKGDDISFGEFGQLRSSRRVQHMYAEGHIDVMHATLGQMQVLSSSEVQLRMFAGGPQQDSFSSRVLRSGHFGSDVDILKTTKTPSVCKTEAA